MEVILFLIIGFGSLIGAFVLEGGHFGSLLEPTAAMIVLGGTLAAIGIGTPLDILKKLPVAFKMALSKSKSDLPSLVLYFKELAFKTRKNGLLSIEGEISSDPDLDPFIKKGLQMIVDGVEPQSVRGILELEAEMTSARHKKIAGMFDDAGAYAPTMGIIGTVMGLVHVLGNLSDPGSLGGSIAVAFIATLYGVATANILWLPIGKKLKALDYKEEIQKTLIIEAILFIQEGVNPNTIGEKLKSFLDKKELVQFDAMDGKAEA